MKKILLAILLGIFCFSSVVQAETRVWVTGDNARTQFVFEFLTQNSSLKKEEISIKNQKVIGQLNGKPWPGVNISLAGPNAQEDGVFIPMSQKVLDTKTFCDDQDRQIRGILARFGGQVPEKPVPVPVVVESSFPLCPCEITGEEKITSSALRLGSNYEGRTVILSHPRQKRIILFWVEDAEGRKVYLPNAEIKLDDINGAGDSEVNYLSHKFDPTTCTFLYIKWWDRVNGADRGRVHKASEVTLNNGLISVSAEDGDFKSNSVEIPWRVMVTSEEHLSQKTASFPKDAVTGLSSSGSESFLLKGGTGTGDRLVEVSSFDGQRIWRTVAQDGMFSLKPRPQGKHLVQIFHFPVDDRKERLKPQVEAEGIYSF